MPFFKEKQFREMDAYLKQGNHAAVIDRMLNWQPAYLALFQEQYPQHKNTLRHTDFTLFWQQRRESLCSTECPEFRFQAQAGLNDADFVTGYVFFLLALKQEESNKADLYDNYLAKAVECSSFHAIEQFLRDLELQANKIAQNEDCYKPLLDALHDLEPVISRHGSAGYMLLSNGYLYVALKTKLLENGRTISDAAFSCVWKYLNLANIAMQHSTEAIHNAYFGLGLSRSNPFHIPTIDNMLNECRKLAGDALPIPTQKLIKTQTLYDYKKLHEQASSHDFKNI